MRKCQQGFTLLEIIIVIILTAILMTVINSIFSNGISAYLAGKNLLDANSQARIGIERMVRDIRSIRSSADILTATSSQLNFIDSNGNNISYQLNGSNLQYNGTTLADGIQTLTFNYFDGNGSATATSSAIRYITITINVVKGNSNYSFTTGIYPRNLA